MSSRRKNSSMKAMKKKRSMKSMKGGSIKKGGSTKKGGGKNAWIVAVTKARKELNIKGFAPVKKGTPLYTKAKSYM